MTAKRNLIEALYAARPSRAPAETLIYENDLDERDNTFLETAERIQREQGIPIQDAAQLAEQELGWRPEGLSIDYDPLLEETVKAVIQRTGFSREDALRAAAKDLGWDTFQRDQNASEEPSPDEEYPAISPDDEAEGGEQEAVKRYDSYVQDLMQTYQMPKEMAMERAEKLLGYSPDSYAASGDEPFSLPEVLEDDPSIHSIEKNLFEEVSKRYRNLQSQDAELQKEVSPDESLFDAVSRVYRKRQKELSE